MGTTGSKTRGATSRAIEGAGPVNVLLPFLLHNHGTHFILRPGKPLKYALYQGAILSGVGMVRPTGLHHIQRCCFGA